MNEERIAFEENIRKDRGFRFGEKMFISFIITFAAGVFCYENYMPEAFMNVYRNMVMIVCLLTWCGFSFSSGKKRKWQFNLFTVLFWLLPQLIIFLADSGPRFLRLSITMYLLSEFSAVLTTQPAEHLGRIINVYTMPCILIIVSLCTFCFLGGMLLSDKTDNTNL